MMLRRTEALLWVATLSLLICASIAFGSGRPSALMEVAEQRATISQTSIPAESLGSWVLRVVEQDPFRLARVPARTPYGTRSSPTVAEPQGITLPSLRLSGVVGPPWRAVLDGPSLDAGRVVAPGDSVAGVLVRDVRRGSVTLRLGDTTWHLTLPRP